MRQTSVCIDWRAFLSSTGVRVIHWYTTESNTHKLHRLTEGAITYGRKKECSLPKLLQFWEQSSLTTYALHRNMVTDFSTPRYTHMCTHASTGNAVHTHRTVELRTVETCLLQYVFECLLWHIHTISRHLSLSLQHSTAPPSSLNICHSVCYTVICFWTIQSTAKEE